MKKLFVGVALAVGLTFSGGTAALATEVTACVPAAAWDEVIHHDAVGTETIPNPEYVPGTPDTTTIVHHDGTPDTTEVTGYLKWTWTNPEKGKGTPDGPPPGEGWHEVGITSDTKGDTPDTILHQGNGYGSYFYFETQTKVTPGEPAWDETVVVPGTPAQGEPTIPNPDYVAPYDETKHHDAVTCPVPPTDNPPTDNPPTTEQPQAPVANSPVVAAAVEQQTVKKAAVTPLVTEQLAETGSREDNYWPLGIALVMLAAGGYIVWRATHRRKTEKLI